MGHPRPKEGPACRLALHGAEFFALGLSERAVCGPLEGGEVELHLLLEPSVEHPADL